MFTFPAIILSLFLLLAPLLGQAGQHALLIGVSDYTEPRIPDLEGAIYDVEALRDVLVTNWQFSVDSVTVLINEDATERAILDALDTLQKTSDTGDDIIIYYSGHGTSALDPDLGSYLNFPDGSGAIVASDFDPKKINRNSLTQPTEDGLLVGRFELRPMLERLDKDRNVLVIFDACFSGNATREVPSAYRPSTKRYIELLALIDESNPPEFLSGDNVAGTANRSLSVQPSSGFHYRNTVYFGAAAEHEYAVEFSADEIAAGVVSTLDGKPHGGFTDSLLRALWEKPAHANTLSFASLFNRTVNQFSIWCKTCGHTPVSLPDPNTLGYKLLGRTILNASPTWHSLPEHASDTNTNTISSEPLIINSDLRADARQAFKSSLAKFSRLSEASEANTSPDIYFENSFEHLKALSSDGALITELSPDLSANNLNQWLLGRQWLKERNLRDSRLEQGNLHVSFRHAMAGNRVYEGDHINFAVISTQATKLLVLVLDANSDLSLIYPVNARERNAVLPALKVQTIPGEGEPPLRVMAPWGTDTVLFYGLNPTHELDPLLRELATLDRIAFDHPQWIAFEAALDESLVEYSSALVRVISTPSP